jgi:hypothetical protein
VTSSPPVSTPVSSTSGQGNSTGASR